MLWNWPIFHALFDGLNLVQSSGTNPPALLPCHRMKNAMAKHPYMQQPKDRSGWEFRVVIPKYLRTKESGREFKRSLGATYEEALVQYPNILLEWATLRADLERQAEAPDRPQRPHRVVTYK